MKKGYLFISNGTKPTSDQATVIKHRVNTFALAPILAAQKLGYKLYKGYNCSFPENLVDADYDIEFYDQHCYRSIFSIKDNIIAYKNLCQFLEAHPNIEVIHCNTPIGGFVGRLCGHKYGIKKIIYTAHGFHFFKGAPLFNRTILKWVEQALAHWTDVIITMNEEDYQAAHKFKLKKGGKVFKVPGVGIINKDYENLSVDKKDIRSSLNIPEDAFVGIAMGDIVPRKNYKTAIEAISLVNNPKLHYIICGRGTQIDELKDMASRLNINEQIHFLGFRTDIKELTYASDFFLFASFQEGLPRSTMEAMACGLPCVVSNIRGNIDLIIEGKGGYLLPSNDVKGFADSIKKLMANHSIAKQMGVYNKEQIKSFDIEIVKQKICDIYNEVLI